jgi:hypothetical protein
VNNAATPCEKKKNSNVVVLGLTSKKKKKLFACSSSGVIWRALHGPSGREFAIKVIPVGDDFSDIIKEVRCITQENGRLTLSHSITFRSR